MIPAQSAVRIGIGADEREAEIQKTASPEEGPAVLVIGLNNPPAGGSA